jgi:hypothetical protein
LRLSRLEGKIFTAVWCRGIAPDDLPQALGISRRQARAAYHAIEQKLANQARAPFLSLVRAGSSLNPVRRERVMPGHVVFTPVSPDAFLDVMGKEYLPCLEQDASKTGRKHRFWALQDRGLFSVSCTCRYCVKDLRIMLSGSTAPAHAGAYRTI